MSTSPLDTPQARRHSEECRILYGKLREYFDGRGDEELLERDNRPALQVVPTLDESGRVRMTIDQLSLLTNVPREVLLDPAEEASLDAVLGV